MNFFGAVVNGLNWNHKVWVLIQPFITWVLSRTIYISLSSSPQWINGILEYILHYGVFSKSHSYVTCSKEISQMSGTLILSYRLREVANSYALHCFWTSKKCSYLRSKMSNWNGVWIYCSTLNEQAIYIEKSKLNIANMWLIPLDRVTYSQRFPGETQQENSQQCLPGGWFLLAQRFLWDANQKDKHKESWRKY